MWAAAIRQCNCSMQPQSRAPDLLNMVTTRSDLEDELVSEILQTLLQPFPLWTSNCLHFGKPIWRCGLRKLRHNSPLAASLSKKLNSTTSSLSYSTEVHHLVLHPPTDWPYDTLREQLIKRTAASEQINVSCSSYIQCRGESELMDWKPTQLLHRMQQFLGDHASTIIIDSAFLCELFLQRLPSNVYMVLASTADTTSLRQPYWACCQAYLPQFIQ